jgi:predicted methyltransferase
MMRSRNRPGFAPCIAFLLSALAAGGAATATPSVSATVAWALADPARSPAERAADAIRKPAETLAFAGIRPGMTVGEFYPGGGYFTRLLSDMVGPRGHVFGIENQGWKGAVKADQALLADGKLSNVSILALPFGTVRFARPLDLVWVTQNYHDLKIAEYGAVDTAAFNRAVFAALKPGGTYFILDHEAPPGTDVAGIARLHRIERTQVIREVEAAGFRLAAEGNFLRRPADDHSLPIFDKKIQGHTDQYALKFVKPKK